jgi:hypothetical protein
MPVAWVARGASSWRWCRPRVGRNPQACRRGSSATHRTATPGHAPAMKISGVAKVSAEWPVTAARTPGRHMASVVGRGCPEEATSVTPWTHAAGPQGLHSARPCRASGDVASRRDTDDPAARGSVDGRLKRTGHAISTEARAQTSARKGRVLADDRAAHTDAEVARVGLELRISPLVASPV